MKLITFKTLLASVCAMSALHGVAQVEEFTPVSEITSGWYQLRQVVGKVKTDISYSAPRYVYSSNTIEPTKSYTFLGMAASPKEDASAFVYVDKGTSDCAIRTLNGVYADALAKPVYTRTAINVTLQDESNKAFSVGTYWDDYFRNPDFMGGSSSSTTARFQFSKVTEETLNKYDIYSVTISGGSNNPTVTTNSSDNKGNATVYNGGSYFFVKGATPTAADFTASAVTGFDSKISVDTEAKTIHVNYYINIFEEGAIYTITNYQKSGTHYALCMDKTHNGVYADEATNTHGNEKLFACHITDEGKVTFSSVATGAYLKYYGYKDNSGNGRVDGQGMSDVYDAIVCDFSFISAASTVADTYIMYTPKREASSTREGVFVIKSDKSFDGYSTAVGYADTYSNLFQFSKVTDFTYNKATLQSKDNKSYASVYLTYPYTLPDGVDAYYGKAVNDDNSQITLTKIEGNVVPMNTAVVLMSESVSGEVSLKPALCTTKTTLDNKLSGTIEDETVASGKTVFGFTGKYENVGFYKWTGEKLPKGKAYLSLDNATAAQGFALNFGDATSIGSVLTDQSTTAKTYYDLGGRRVSNPTKGVYIVNGKKVIIK